MIPLLIGIFLIILFIVVVVLSAATWRGWHIAAASLTFLAVIGLIIVASLSQKTHATWRSKHSDLKKQLVVEKNLGIKMKIGDPTLVEPDEPSLDDVQQRLGRLLLDRGRVWRRCIATNPPANNQIVISTVPLNEDGTPGDPNAAKENGISKNMILYGFREGELTLPEGNKIRVPVAYLGEFIVVDAQPNAVTLTQTSPLDGQQKKLVADTTASWALYEMMPIDAHRIFAKQDTIGQPLDNTKDQPIFGGMDEQQLRAIFANVTGLTSDDPLITQLVSSYVKDGYAASDQDVNTLPTNIWQKLEFEKAHKERVNSNNLDPGISGGFFDFKGFAEVTRLRSREKNSAGEYVDVEASFRVNDIGVFPYGYDEDKQVVDQLIANGTCQKIGPIYVRSLRDYEEAFHSIQERFIKRTEDSRRVQRDIANLNTTIQKTQEEIAYRQSEREKLKSDQTGFARDNTKMDTLLAALETQKSTLSNELSNLFRTNLALSQQLTVYSDKITEEINRRAASVAVQ